MTLDCKRNSGGNAPLSSMILLQVCHAPVEVSAIVFQLCHTPVEAFSRDVDVYDGLEFRESLVIVSGALSGAGGADGIKQHLGGVLIAWAPRGSTSVPYLGSTRRYWL